MILVVGGEGAAETQCRVLQPPHRQKESIMKSTNRHSVMMEIVASVAFAAASAFGGTTYYCKNYSGSTMNSAFVTPASWNTSVSGSGTDCSAFDGTGDFVVNNWRWPRVQNADTFNAASLLVCCGYINFYSAGNALTVGDGTATVTLQRGHIFNNRKTNDGHCRLYAKVLIKKSTIGCSSLSRANSYAGDYDGVRGRLYFQNQVSCEEGAIFYVGHCPDSSVYVSTKGHTFDVYFEGSTAGFYGDMIVTSRVANVTYPTYGNRVNFSTTTSFPGSMTYYKDTALSGPTAGNLEVGTLAMHDGSTIRAASNSTIKVTGAASFEGKINVRLDYTPAAVSSKTVLTILESPTALDLDNFVLDRRTLTNFDVGSAELVLSEDGKKLQVVLYSRYWLLESYSDSSTYHAAWANNAAWKNSAGKNPEAIDDDRAFGLDRYSWLRIQTSSGTTFGGHSLTVGSSSYPGYLNNYDWGMTFTHGGTGWLVFYNGYFQIDRNGNWRTTEMNVKVYVAKSPNGSVFKIYPANGDVGETVRFTRAFASDADAVLQINSGGTAASDNFTVKLEGDASGYLGTLNVTSITTQAVSPEAGSYGTRLCLGSTTLPGAVSMASNTVLSTVASDSKAKIGTLTLLDGSWISVVGKEATIEVTDSLAVEGTVAVRIDYSQTRPTADFELPILKSPTALDLGNFRLVLGKSEKTLSRAALALSDDGKTLIVRRVKPGLMLLLK